MYVLVISVLVLVLLNRADVYFAIAERATVDATLNNTQSALYVRLAQDRLQGNLSRERLWDGGNAFELARMEVKNYAGVLDTTEAIAALRQGAWAFDSLSGVLVYVPQHPKGLWIDGGGTHLRFRLRVLSTSAIPVIEAAVPYRWDP